jgi:peptidoglycan/LPS O-acetylase OafA/YrhL
MHNNNFSYRPDIDGLRALAVLAVVIYHFNKQWLPGGFVGVDIFFVISGYLITGIIYSKGTNFSFADFYGRRVRRILPAAIFVTAVTLIAGSFLLMPADVKALSGSAIASALSGANIYYWLFLDTSYFAASSDTVPLLHMWSLGVEEQFYLIWPALMIIAMRLGGKRLLVGAAVLIAAASFAVSEYYVSRDPSFAYYMLPSRAGELLVGALLFLWQDSRRTLTTGAANVAGAVGLLMVGYSLALLSETGGFPGIRSIIPAVGTALLIASGINQGSVLARALTNPLFRYIGLRSFSLYLWHWPVLAFYRYAYGEPSLIGGLVCALIMLGLTELSYRMIETPFRSHTPRWLITKAAPIFASSALVIGSGLVLTQFNGLWPVESSKSYQRLLNIHDLNTKSAAKFAYNCQMFKPGQDYWTEPRCVIGDKSENPEVLLWGDSNAAQFIGYFKVVGEKYGFSFRNISHSSCPPFVGEAASYVPPVIFKSCTEFNKRAFDESKKYKTVIVGAAWQTYARGDGFERFEKAIETLATNGNRVIVALNVPVFDGLDRMCDAKAIRIPGMDCYKQAVYESTSEMAVNERLIAIAEKFPNVSTFSIRDYVCKKGICSAYQGGSLLYFDRGHLSMTGSETIGKQAIENGEVPRVILSLSPRAAQLSSNGAE